MEDTLHFLSSPPQNREWSEFFGGAVFIKQGHLEVLLLCSGINAGILKETVSPPIFTIWGNES